MRILIIDGHLIILVPLWLGAMPAVLKPFFEQTLRPGFAFRLAAAQFFQKRCISMKVNDADQVISTKPVSASVPVTKRTGPAGTTSPRPSVVKQTAE